MALIAIVAAIAVPQWQRYATNADLKTAAREVMADLSNSEADAGQVRRKSGCLSPHIQCRRQQLRPVSRTETTGVTWNTAWTKSLASFGNGISIDSINFSGGSVVNFQKRGTLSSWGDLILRNGRDSRATVTVNITGRTYVTFAMQ